MRVTADQWSAESAPQANGLRKAPECFPGHLNSSTDPKRHIKHFLAFGWVTGLVLTTIWGARKPSAKRHAMASWVSWADPHQIMRIRIRQKRFEILKVHFRLFNSASRGGQNRAVLVPKVRSRTSSWQWSGFGLPMVVNSDRCSTAKCPNCAKPFRNLTEGRQTFPNLFLHYHNSSERPRTAHWKHGHSYR
jgi:hypothetical protein